MIRSISIAFFLSTVSCGPPVREVKSAEEYGDVEEEPMAPRQRKLVEQEPEAPEVEAKVPEAEEPPAPKHAPVKRKYEELEAFYDAFDALREGDRTEHLRVFWLGDSHTAADFMTHPVRKHLARLGGDGGPGFVRLGLGGYRHGVVRLAKHGRWRKAPILPAQRTRVLDGVFGYGGIRTLPAAAAGVSAEVREKNEQPMRWILGYRLLSGAQLEARIGDKKWRIRAAEETAFAGGIEWQSFSGSDGDKFSIHHVAGDPQVFGAFGEYEQTGVVLDTVGINGARAATALAWEPEQFVAQVKERAPSLLVLAFGTNEVFDQTGVHRYLEHNKKLVALAREAVPQLPCWIVGAPDSATKEGNSKRRVTQVNEVQRQAAKEMNCAFTSAFELMGGEGSFSRWAKERPAKARGDRIHLTILGYETLGQLLAEALIEAEPLLAPESEVPTESSAATTSP